MRTKNLDHKSAFIDLRVATARGGLFAFGLLIAASAIPFAADLVATPALSQAMAQGVPQNGHPAKAERPGFLESLGKWFSDQADNLNSSFKDAGKKVQDFGHEAGVAAQSTVDGAKNAAGAVANMSSARVVSGHEKCRIAPNGAPDCVAAATAICKAKGFASGKSADMTTSEVCPPSVYIAGRNSGPECRTETFVSRALCQ
jgi:predicted phage tail protein